MDTPNHDLIAERQVLGAALDARPYFDRAAEIIDGTDFYQPDHELIWETIQQLRSEDVHADVATVSQRLIAGNVARLSPLVFDLWSNRTSGETVEYHATIVREKSRARALSTATLRAHERANRPDADPDQVASDLVQEIEAINAAGGGEEWGELIEDILAESEDDTPEWVIPGLLAARDRLVITGGEGAGKSTYLRQLAFCTAAGIHPFSLKPIPPKNVLIIDVENNRDQFRSESRPVFIQANKLGQSTLGRIMVRNTNSQSIDITQAKTLNRIQRMVAKHKPALILIGPLYKLRPGNGNTEEEVSPVLFALDSLREHGAAIVTEAHAGNSQTDGHRNWRPRGSSVLLGWPEFGFGMERIKDEPDKIQVIRWRGDRSRNRDWPTHYKPGGTFPWSPDFQSAMAEAEFHSPIYEPAEMADPWEHEDGLYR